MKFIARRKRGFRRNTLTGEESFGHLAHECLECDLRNRQKCRPMQDVSKFASKIAVGNRFRRNPVQWPGQRILLNSMPNETNDVLDVNPREPLSAAAKRTAHTKLKRREHLGQRAAFSA